MMASSFASAISFFARSIRPRRSSVVIGFTRSRIDVSAAMLGGSGPVDSDPRPRWAETRVMVRLPATAPVRVRKWRLVSMMVKSVLQAPAVVPELRSRQRGRKEERAGAVSARELVRLATDQLYHVAYGDRGA